MPRPSTFFTEAAGVPLHYDRHPPPFNYGTRGKPFRAFMTQAFFDKLDACFQELWTVCPLGQAEVVTSAGAYVNKPGAHGQGRAIDIDGSFWSDTSFIALYRPTWVMSVRPG